jgi:hypothetical protein
MKSNNEKEENHKKDEMKIEVEFPECVRIELVQGNDLRNYEIFTWLSSFFSTAAAGFWVAFASVPFNKVLFGVSIIFTLFTLLFGCVAFYYRGKMKGNKIVKSIQMKD